MDFPRIPYNVLMIVTVHCSLPAPPTPALHHHALSFDSVHFLVP